MFVYNLGMDKIPTGPNSDTIKAEMYESALRPRSEQGERAYKKIEPLDEKVIPFGNNKAAPQLRRKRYEIEIAKEGPAITELYVTGHKNHFIKIRHLPHRRQGEGREGSPNCSTSWARAEVEG